MQKIQKKLYRKAIRNEKFNKQYLKADKNALIPERHMSDILKVNYAMMYLGWLIGRKEFNREDYER